MKLVVSSGALESRVKNLRKVLSAKNVLPILDSLLFEVVADENTAILTTSDSEIWLSYNIDLVEVDDSVKFCVDAATLADMLSGIGEQPVTITVDMDTCELTLKHNDGSSYCPVEPADEYPMHADLDNSETMVTAEGAILKNAIKRSLWAANRDTLRPIMNGVYFEFDNDRADIVASDGHQIMWTVAVLSHMNEWGSFVMPSKVAKILPDLIDDDDIILCFDSSRCSIKNDQMDLHFRFIDGNYPNFKSVFPETFAHDVLCDRVGLINALQSVNPFTPDSSNMAKLTLCKPDTLEISANDSASAVGSTIRLQTSSDYAGDPTSIGIKASRLITMLQKMTTKEVSVRFNDSSHAVCIVPYHDNYDKVSEIVKGMTMPMLLNDDSNNHDDGQTTEG